MSKPLYSCDHGADAVGAPPWFVTRVKHGQASRAIVHLKQQGFVVFRPVLPSSQQPSTRGDLPLFARHLFVREAPGSAPLRAVNSTIGIAVLVGRTPQKPAPVPAALIEELTNCFGSAGSEIVGRVGTQASTIPTLHGIENLPADEREVLLLRMLFEAGAKESQRSTTADRQA